MSPARAAVFLDRDGVLVQDRGLVTRPEQLVLCEGAAEAVGRLDALGFVLVVVTNQAVVARGLVDLDQLADIHRALLTQLGGGVAKVFACPHHPDADVAEYRVSCTCRKPEPGMILQAAAELDLDLSRSWMVGDRPSDVAAGFAAGCRTALIESGRHLDAPIRTARPFEAAEPDLRVPSLAEFVERLT